MKTATKLKGMAMTARNVPKVMSGNKTQTRRIESELRDLFGDELVRAVEPPNENTFFRFSFERKLKHGISISANSGMKPTARMRGNETIGYLFMNLNLRRNHDPF